MGIVKPVQVGDEVEMECISKGQKGDGVCKIQGFVVFVPKAEPRMHYQVRITRIQDTVGFGEIVREL